MKFNGFPEQALPFLKALAFHQNREWFHENKQQYYDYVKSPMGDLIEDVSQRFASKNIPLKGDRKHSLFRVNRDVRFSKNKDPYSTHAGAMLTRNGTKKDQGFVYTHFSNERCFIAAGFRGLDGTALRALRELILREPDRFEKHLISIEKSGAKLDIEGMLKRNPRGFENVEDPSLQRWIRLKNFTFIDELTPEVFSSQEIAKRMLTLGQHSLEFLNFGWRAIDSVRDA